MKIEKLMGRLANINDPRRTNCGNILHKLEDIVIIGLCCIICGGEDFADMEEFGKEREEFLRKFLELPNGIPDSDTFRRLFERLDPQELSECLVNWLEDELPARCTVAIDGKTIRGSANKNHKAYHVVSAFVAENQITLGEICVDEKTNEITAVPELLDLLDIEDTIITADAMSCQKAIVEKTISKNADYVIGLKSNQRSLYGFAKKIFEENTNNYPVFETTQRLSGRNETRRYYLETNVAGFSKIKEWQGLKALGKVVRETENGSEVKQEIRYFITSLTDLNEFAGAVRKHWAIENNLHWSLDVIFREDASHAKKDNSPLNLNVLRKTSLSLLSKAKFGRLSKKKLMFKASLNPDVLLNILLSYS